MKKLNKIKTIDVFAREWFDKVNGNSYFSGTVTVNYGMKGEREYNMPFQYGYGSQYEYEALQVLIKNEKIKCKDRALWQFCKDNKIILRSDKRENCKKRELMQ